MEEDIKILEELIKEGFSAMCPLEAKAIENLLKRYKELEEDNKTKLEIYELGKENARKRIEYDYIPISVIQNKIEELKEQFRDYDAKWTKALRDKRHPFYRYLIRIEAEIDILQELLEERNK